MEESANNELAAVKEVLRTKYRHPSARIVKVTFDRLAPRIDVGNLYVEVSIVESNEFDQFCRSPVKATSSEAVFLKLGARALGNQIALSHVFCEEDTGRSRLTQTTAISPASPSTVVIVGPAGSGKTIAVTKKLPLDWANGVFAPNALLLFVIPVRNVYERCGQLRQGDTLVSTGAQSVEELIRSTHRELLGDNMKTVMEFLSKNRDDTKVLFVIDGLDEASIERNSVLYKLITRQLPDISPHYRVLLTARPCPTVEWLRDTGKVDRHVTLAGFSPQSRDEFFAKYGREVYRDRWSEMELKLWTLVKHVDGISLGDILCLPMIATLFVHSLQNTEVSDLIALQSSAEFLQVLLVGLFKRDNVPDSAMRRAWKFSELRGEQISSVHRLAKQAYDMTVAGEFVFIDTLDETDVSSADVTGTGLRNDDHGVLQCFTFSFIDMVAGGSVTRRQFIHLSVQEILCAFHVASQLQLGSRDAADTFERLVRDLAKSTNYGTRFTQVFEFLTGMVHPEELPILFHALMTQVCVDRDPVHGNFMMKTICTLFMMMLYEASQVRNSDGQHRAQFLEETAHSLVHFFKRRLVLAIGSQRNELAFVLLMKLCPGQFECIDMEEYYLPSQYRQIGRALVQCQPQACHVDLHFRRGRLTAGIPDATQDDVAHPLGVVDSMPLLSVSDVGVNADIIPLCDMITNSVNLRNVGISADDISTNASRSLCRSLEENTTVNSLSLRFSTIKEQRLNILTQVCSYTRITKLDLFGFTAGDWPSICDIIAQGNHITHLRIGIRHTRSNAVCTRPIKELTESLCMNRTLHTFSLLSGPYYALKVDSEKLAIALFRTIRSHPRLQNFRIDNRMLCVDDATLVLCMRELIKLDDISHGGASLDERKVPQSGEQSSAHGFAADSSTITGDQSEMCMAAALPVSVVGESSHFHRSSGSDTNGENRHTGNHTHSRRVVGCDYSNEGESQRETYMPPASKPQCRPRSFHLVLDPAEHISVTGIRECIRVLESEVDLDKRWHINFTGWSSAVREELRRHADILRPVTLWCDTTLDVSFSMDTVTECPPVAKAGDVSAPSRMDTQDCDRERRANPWTLTVFTNHFRPRLMTIDPELLRNAVSAQGMLPVTMEKDLRLHSQTPGEHNAKLLDHLSCDGNMESFKCFHVAVHNLSYRSLSRELHEYIEMFTGLDSASADEQITTSTFTKEADPWNNERYLTDVHPTILGLEPDLLRLCTIPEGLLTIGMQQALEDLQSQGRTAHNARLIDYIRPDGMDAYRRFLEVLTRMDLCELRQEMKTLITDG